MYLIGSAEVWQRAGSTRDQPFWAGPETGTLVAIYWFLVGLSIRRETAEWLNPLDEGSGEIYRIFYAES